MNALANLDSKYMTLAGVTGGLLSWIAGNIQLVTQVASCVGAVCGALLAVISLFARCAGILRNWRRRRARLPFTEPHDVDDNIPGV